MTVAFAFVVCLIESSQMIKKQTTKRSDFLMQVDREKIAPSAGT